MNILPKDELNQGVEAITKTVASRVTSPKSSRSGSLKVLRSTLIDPNSINGAGSIQGSPKKTAQRNGSESENDDWIADGKPPKYGQPKRVESKTIQNPNHRTWSSENKPRHVSEMQNISPRSRPEKPAKPEKPHRLTKEVITRQRPPPRRQSSLQHDSDTKAKEVSAPVIEQKNPLDGRLRDANIFNDQRDLLGDYHSKGIKIHNEHTPTDALRSSMKTPDAFQSQNSRTLPHSNMHSDHVTPSRPVPKPRKSIQRRNSYHRYNLVHQLFVKLFQQHK